MFRRLPHVEHDQPTSKTWHGYVCPGCRTVFRVAADFQGNEVTCPVCHEVLKLPQRGAPGPSKADPPDGKPEDGSADLKEISDQAGVEEPTPAADEPVAAMAAPPAKKGLGRFALPLAAVAAVGVLWLVVRKPAPAPPQAAVVPAPPVVAVEEITPPAVPAPPATESPPAIVDAPPAVAAAPAVTAAAPEMPAAPPIVETPPSPAVQQPDDGLVEVVHDEPPPAPPAPPAVKPAPAEAPAAQAPPPAVRHHTVVKGDTLGRIARKYGVTPRQIMQANGMKSDVVRLGGKLIIPAASAR